MPQAYNIKTTAEQREIIDVALKNQKKLAQDGFSLLHRLGQSPEPAVEAIGACEHLIDSLRAINVGERDAKDWEILTQPSVEQLRAALVNFARQATKQNEHAHQLTLSTDVSKKTKAVQDIFDQVSEQLNLGLTSIDDAIVAMNVRPPRDEQEGDADPIEQDDAVQPAPHRGQRSGAKSHAAVAGSISKGGKATTRKAARKK